MARIFLTIVLASGLAFSQPSLTFKTRHMTVATAAPVMGIESPRTPQRAHFVMQFHQPVTSGAVRELRSRGVTVLADVPENGLIVSIGGRVSLRGLNVRYAAAIAPADKISPLIGATPPNGYFPNGYFMVEFYRDVDPGDARSLVLNAGIELAENPDLGPNQLMIHSADSSAVQRLAALDEVSYIFPASDELAHGIPVRACAGALTTNGTTMQSIPTYGNGWDGPGLGSATVYYYYSNVTSQLNAAAAKAEIARAMAQWASAVQVNWLPGTSATASQTVNILWGTYNHGDAYPFDGPGGVLAHTFYPAPPNPEPIAGDMHLDDSENWHIGTNTDLFSVTLHELGHALGLGHSDHPADVMYPYYKIVTGLNSGDIAAAQTLYAARTDSTPVPPGNPTPSTTLTLTVNAVASTTTTSTLNLSGAASGGSGAITVTWSSASGASGMAAGSVVWTISNIALVLGLNTITVTATAGTSRVSQIVTVTRQATGAPPTNTGGSGDTTPPSLTITSPGATSISTSAASMVFSGTTSDNVGVTSVAWSTNTGESGIAAGTTNWSAAIPLLTGSNVVTIRAYDAAGNSGWRSVVVTKH